jgi:cytochrome c peroxidase
MNIPNEQLLVDRLKEVDLYQNLFSQAFLTTLKPITYSNIRNAIGAFERTLVTPSRFDEFMKGK